MDKEWEEKKDLEDTSAAKRDWYTQREWDRVVGYGKVPQNYSRRDN